MNKFEKDLSKGSVPKQLLLFALPFILSNLIQSLYSVADLVIVGQFNGIESISGVNNGGQIIFIITNLIIGLCVGGTVLIAQYLGAGKKKELKETVGTLFTVLLIVGVFFTVLMFLLRQPLLRMIKAPAEAFPEADSYLSITTLGILFIFGYNALGAVMRGMGDSRRPLVFVGIACSVNVLLDLLLVGVFGMKAFGAALATIISQALSMILCIIYLRKNEFVFNFERRSFGIHKERLKMLLKIGIPTSVQNTAASISFLLLTAMANSLGVTESAAIGAVGKFNAFAVLPSIAICLAVASMSAQNIGAGLEDRAVKTMKTGLVFAFSISIATFSLSRLFPNEILSIFSDDPNLMQAGATYLKVFSYDYLSAALLFGFTGLFMGSGHTGFSLMNSIISSILVRVPAAYFFGFVLKMGMFGIGLGAPIASAAALILSVWYYFSGRWKKKVILKNQPEEAVPSLES